MSVSLLVLVLFVLSIITLLVAWYEIKKNQNSILLQKKEIQKQIYQTLIFREISERIGYELDIQKIAEIITSSLPRLLTFSTVSYLLPAKDSRKLTMTFYLQEPVSQNFLEAVKAKALEELAGRWQTDSRELEAEMRLTGTIVDEADKGGLNFCLHIPLRVGERVAGLITVASKGPKAYKAEDTEILEKMTSAAGRQLERLQAILASEKGKLVSMVASMADGVLMFDQKSDLVVINPAAADLLDLDKEKEVTTFEVAEALSDKIDLRTKVEQAVRTNELVTVKDLLFNDRYTNLLISAVRDAAGENLGAVVLFHDTTSEKQLERLREDFTAMMVHELRTPLTVIRGTSDTLLINPKIAEGDQGRQLLSSLKFSSESMLSLVNDLLDVAKIEAGKFQVMKTENKLQDLVLERVEFFQALARQKGLRLMVEVDQNMPAFEFDKQRITQVLFNLLSNAIKYTDTGQILVKVFWEESEEKKAIVSVADTGTGIAEEKQRELFSKFHQLKISKEEKTGSGLGLVIAKGIVESHGGKMWIESRVGSGTTFYFSLPI